MPSSRTNAIWPKEQTNSYDRKTKCNRFIRTICKYRENVINKWSGNVRRKNFFYLRNTVVSEREHKVKFLSHQGYSQEQYTTRLCWNVRCATFNTHVIIVNITVVHWIDVGNYVLKNTVFVKHENL